MPEIAVDELEGKEGKRLLAKTEMARNLRNRIPGGHQSVGEEESGEPRPLCDFQDVHPDIDGNDQAVNDGE
jgi:hypothetical protein